MTAELEPLVADYLSGREGAAQVLSDALLERGLPPLKADEGPVAQLEAALELLSFPRQLGLSRAAARLALSRLPARSMAREASEVLEANEITPELRSVAFRIWRLLDRESNEAARVVWAIWMLARGQPLLALRTLRALSTTELATQLELVASALHTPGPAAAAAAPDEEARFWSLLEDAWAPQGDDVNAARKALAERNPDDEAETAAIERALERMIETLGSALSFDDFPREELVAMDRVLERKLHELDREDVHEVIDGSDDGFLYARGFIVAAGQSFFEAVRDEPRVAMYGPRCESLCGLPFQIHRERFGAPPNRG